MPSAQSSTSYASQSVNYLNSQESHEIQQMSSVALTPPEAKLPAAQLLSEAKDKFHIGDDSIRSFLLSQCDEQPKQHAIKLIKENPQLASSKLGQHQPQITKIKANKSVLLNNSHSNSSSSSNLSTLLITASSSSSSSSNPTVLNPAKPIVLAVNNPELMQPKSILTTTVNLNAAVANSTVQNNQQLYHHHNHHHVNNSSLVITPADSPANADSFSSSSNNANPSNNELVNTGGFEQAHTQIAEPASFNSNSLLIQRLNSSIAPNTSVTISPNSPSHFKAIMPPPSQQQHQQPQPITDRVVRLKARSLPVNVTALKLVPIQGEKKLLQARTVKKTLGSNQPQQQHHVLKKQLQSGQQNSKINEILSGSDKQKSMYLMPIVFTAMPNTNSSTNNNNSNNNKKVTFTVISQSTTQSQSVLSSINNSTLNALLNHLQNKNKQAPPPSQSVEPAQPVVVEQAKPKLALANYLDELNLDDDWPIQLNKNSDINSQQSSVKAEPMANETQIDKFDFISDLTSSINNNNNSTANNTNYLNFNQQVSEPVSDSNQIISSIDFLDNLANMNPTNSISSMLNSMNPVNLTEQNDNDMNDLFDSSSIFGTSSNLVDCLANIWH